MSWVRKIRKIVRHMNMSSVASASYCGGVYYWRSEKHIPTKVMYNSYYVIKTDLIGLRMINQTRLVVDASDPDSDPHYVFYFIKCRDTQAGKYVLVNDMFVPLIEDMFDGRQILFGEPRANEMMLKAAKCAIDSYHRGVIVVSMDNYWIGRANSKTGEIL